LEQDQRGNPEPDPDADDISEPSAHSEPEMDEESDRPEYDNASPSESSSDEEQSADESSSSDTDHEVSEVEEDDLLDHLDDPSTSDPNSMTIGSVLLTLFQWMAKHKSTDSATNDLWSFMRLLLPKASDIGTFRVLQTLLEKHMANTVEEIHLCVNGCIGFFNCESPELAHYQHAHRTVCVKCGEARYLPGGKIPRKVVYYFPLRPWIKDLFRSFCHYWLTIIYIG
jgi:hypothetical protein